MMKTEHQIRARGSYLAAENGSSAIVDLSPFIERTPDSIVTPPNSSIMFPECASIPLLKPISNRESAGSAAPSLPLKNRTLRPRRIWI